MCGNDDLASQVVKVLSENRMAGKVAVVAQDADLAACQRIVEGTQDMTVYKPIEQEANTAAEFAVALGNGEDIVSGNGKYKAEDTFYDGTYDIPYYKIDPIAVTAENMDQVIIDGEIPYAGGRLSEYQRIKTEIRDTEKNWLPQGRGSQFF